MGNPRWDTKKLARKSPIERSTDLYVHVLCQCLCDLFLSCLLKRVLVLPCSDGILVRGLSQGLD